jgi:hypothetical protein
MTFNNVAINDGCVARLEFRRNLVLCFYTRKILDVLDIYRETVVLKVNTPACAASSSG